MAYRKGITLSLGLISFQVDLDGAVAKEESLRNVCLGDGTTQHDPTPIKNNPACPACGNADFASFKKASVHGNEYSIVEADEVKEAKDKAIGATKNIVALTAHRSEDVRLQTIQDGGVYYLSPSSAAAAAGYALMVETLKEHPEVSLLGMWTAVSRTNLYELKVFGDTLVLEQRARTQDIKVVQVPVSAADATLKAQMGMILPMMTQDFDPDSYSDAYRKALDELVESKQVVEGVQTSGGGTNKSRPVAAVDLTDALNQMLAAQKQSA